MLKRMQNSLNEHDNRYELGGSYFELIEFSLQRRLPDGREMTGIYGINVVKVREVVHMPKINPLPSRVPGIAGIFELRGIPIPAVNLCAVLGDYNSPLTPDQQIIVAEFSQKRAGFIVHATNRIRRVAWDKVLPPSADASSAITGMMLVEKNEFLFILDLEKIVAQLEGSAHGHMGMNIHNPMMGHSADMSGMGMGQSSQQNMVFNRFAPGVLLVDDSNLILSNFSRLLAAEGYRVLIARNGLEALNVLRNSMQPNHPNGPIHAIITDLEMPQMDGLSFLREVRHEPRFNKIPVYLHTSLSDTNSKQKGEKLGANGFFVKNDVANIMDTLKSHFQSNKVTA